jgi:hypothetical protein
MSQLAASLKPEVSLRPRPAAAAGERVVPAILAIAILCGQTYLVAGRNFATILETPFLPYCLLGSFAIHFWTRPARVERIVTTMLGAVSGAAFIAFSGRYHFDWPSSIACGAFLGLASLSVLAVQTVRLRGDEQKEKLHTLLAGSVLGYSALFIAYILTLTTRLHPRTYDLFLYAADAGFGIPIGVWLAQFVGGRPLLLQACSVVYESLPLAVSLLFAYERSGKKPIEVQVLPAFLGGGAAAYALYNFLPATGPHYVFGAAFPNAMPPSSAALHLVTVGNYARNAVPSMHLACALMIFWACRPLARWVRLGAGLFLILTILATLGFGEHYVVDLVAAVPYALAVQAICARRDLAGSREYRRAIWIGLGLTLWWMALLRFAVPMFQSYAFTWTAALATIGISAMCRIALCRDSSIPPLPCSHSPS